MSNEPWSDWDFEPSPRLKGILTAMKERRLTLGGSFFSEDIVMSHLNGVRELTLDSHSEFHLKYLDNVEDWEDLVALDINCSLDNSQLRFLKRCHNIIKLDIPLHTVASFPQDLLPLHDGLYPSLEALRLSGAKYDFSYLTCFPNLHNLTITLCSFSRSLKFPDTPMDLESLIIHNTLDDVSSQSLESPYVSSTLKTLRLSYVGFGVRTIDQPGDDGLSPKPSPVSSDDLYHLGFLDSYRQLETLEVSSPGILDYSGLASPSIRDTLRHIQLDKCPSFSDLGLLKQQPNLCSIDIEGTGVTDISPVLGFECVKTVALEKIKLPESVNWTQTKNGAFINTETVIRLKELDVKVVLPETFPYGEDDTSRPRPKLYIILGPSCAGKSTLIDYVRELGCKSLQKISDRDSRLDDDLDKIVLVSEEEFRQRAGEGEIVAIHEFHKALYGVGYLGLIEAKTSQENYFLDSCDPFSALRLRDAYPDFVKLVFLDTPGNLVEGRMRERELKEYKIGDIERAAKNMQQRRYALSEEYTKFRAFKNDMDYIIEDNPFKEMKKIMGDIDG